jgi:ketosteroid isomerase-like protein
MADRKQIVWRLYNEGWGQGNFDLVFELLHPDIVWTAIEDAPDAGTYRGHDGVRAYMQDWLDDFDLEGWSIEESSEVDELLVCAQRGRGRGKGSGLATDISYACVYRFADDDRIVVLNEYATYDEALAAARVPSSSAS